MTMATTSNLSHCPLFVMHLVLGSVSGAAELDDNRVQEFN